MLYVCTLCLFLSFTYYYYKYYQFNLFKNKMKILLFKSVRMRECAAGSGSPFEEIAVLLLPLLHSVSG